MEEFLGTSGTDSFIVHVDTLLEDVIPEFLGHWKESESAATRISGSRLAWGITSGGIRKREEVGSLMGETALQLLVDSPEPEALNYLDSQWATPCYLA